MREQVGELSPRLGFEAAAAARAKQRNQADAATLADKHTGEKTMEVLPMQPIGGEVGLGERDAVGDDAVVVPNARRRRADSAIPEPAGERIRRIAVGRDRLGADTPSVNDATRCTAWFVVGDEGGVGIRGFGQQRERLRPKRRVAAGIAKGGHRL